ncbi:MAG: FG-GAP repeat protein [Planctomycetota bacterium]
MRHPRRHSTSYTLKMVLILIFCMFLAHNLPAQCAIGNPEIFGVGAGDYLGRSVAVSGGRIFAGAIGDDSGGVLSGTVRIFRRNGTSYALEQILQGEPGSELGSSISVDGDLLVVGAVGSQQIIVWRKERYSWEMLGMINDPGGHAEDGFGSSVSLHGDLLAVGSPYFETGAGPVGCVTIWKLNSSDEWQLETRLLAQDRVPGDQFGTAVDLGSDSELIVGAPGRDYLGLDTGAAYLFHGGLDGWVEEIALGSGAANSGDKLGTAVAIADDHILLGAPYSDLAGPAAGAVAVYQRIGEVWVLKPHLLPTTGASGCAFGASIALDGNLASVGAPTDTGNEAFPAGSVSVYRWQGDWLLAGIQTGNPSSFLGSAVAVDLGVVAIGAPLDSTHEIVGGNITVSIFGDEDCDQNNQQDSCEIAAGTAADCDRDGVLDSCGIAAGMNVDCDGDGIPDSCSTLEGLVADCDADGIPDVCSVPAGQVTDCDSDGIPDICQSDCNQNLIPDSCEILQGLALDCDEDGVIDACALAAGNAEDCNGDGSIDACDDDCDNNGISDVCDFLNGSVEDCNNNHIPDICDLNNPQQDVNENGALDDCEAQFIRGDADGVQGVRLADAILLIGRVFGNNSIPGCLEAADANADGLLDISDGINLLFYLYANGEAPPPPFPDCGISPIDANFPCDDHPTCP